MSFVKFTEVGKHFQPRAVITAGGVISLNQGARKKFNLDDWSHCIMYLDPDAHTIGLELVNDEDMGGANRLRHIRHEGVDVNAKSFLDHFKLRIRRPLSFRVTRDLESEWLVIRLDDAEVVGVEKEEEPLQEQKKEPAVQAVAKPAAVNKTADVSDKSSVVVIPARVSSSPVPRAETVAVTVSPVQTVARSNRGVKAMLSELLQD